MEIQILKKQYKDAIKKDVYLKAQIAAINEVSTWTVDRWRTDDSPLLTTATNLSIIRTRLKVADNVTLTEPVNTGKKRGKVKGHVSVV
jgi:hypothetical protein